jgi:hypothetical protein
MRLAVRIGREDDITGGKTRNPNLQVPISGSPWRVCSSLNRATLSHYCEQGTQNGDRLGLERRVTVQNIAPPLEMGKAHRGQDT